MNLQYDWGLFYTMLITLAPCIFFCYAPFTSHIRRNVKRLLAEIVITLILYCYIAAWLMTDIPDGYISMNQFCIIFLIPGLIYFFFTVDAGVHKLLFVFSIALNLASFAGSLGMFLLFFNPTGLSHKINITILHLLLYGIGSITVHIWMRPMLERLDDKDLRLMFLIPVAFSVVLIMYFENTIDQQSIDPLYPMVFIVFNLIAFALYYIILRMLNKSAESAMLKENNRMMAAMASQQSIQYEQLSGSINQMRAMRHDMRHHFAAILSLANQSDSEKIGLYCQTILNAIPKESDLHLCDNVAVNAIAQYYTGIAKDNHIAVSINLDIPQSIWGVKDMDLCIIIGNLMENAIEAAAHIPPAERTLALASMVKGGYMTITLDNAFDGIVKTESGRYFSRKRDMEGIGLSSVRRVAQQYDGSATFEPGGRQFLSSVALKLPTAPAA